MDQQFQTAPQQGQKTPAQPAPLASPLANPLDDPALQHPLAENSDICYCRNCGGVVPKSAAVCVHCDYVIDPSRFEQERQSIQAQEQAEESAMRIRRFLRVINGTSNEPDPQFAPPTRRQHFYRFQPEGAVYCTNCGSEVGEGASICVNCKYVINPEAVHRAQLLIQNRNATLSREDLLKSYLIPGYGRKMFRANIANRPQIAKPCRIAGYVNTGVIALLLFLIVFFL